MCNERKALATPHPCKVSELDVVRKCGWNSEQAPQDSGVLLLFESVVHERSHSLIAEIKLGFRVAVCVCRHASSREANANRANPQGASQNDLNVAATAVLQNDTGQSFSASYDLCARETRYRACALSVCNGSYRITKNNSVRHLDTRTMCDPG